MVSINNEEAFEHYYQTEYDYNTSSLTEQEIYDIKELAREKRVNYALAPIGEKIFNWIEEQNSDIHFELVNFESEKIDGMLYIPEAGLEKAYIILNSNKPLINQIFTSAHEYYHYIKDYAIIKETPYICNFNSLESINEKKASRFAAEFLLPEEALRSEIRFMRKRMDIIGESKLGFEFYATIAIMLTVKYQMPLKAVIYRLHEEGYIKNIIQYIKNYDFIKNIMRELKIFEKKVDYLYSNKNEHLDADGIIYRQMKTAYDTGYAARDEIMHDAEILRLDRQVVQDFFDNTEDDDKDDDLEMQDYLRSLLGEHNDITIKKNIISKSVPKTDNV